MGMSITENAGAGAGDKRLYKGAPSAEGVQASNRAKRGSWRVAGASDRRFKLHTIFSRFCDSYKTPPFLLIFQRERGCKFGEFWLTAWMLLAGGK